MAVSAMADAAMAGSGDVASVALISRSTFVDTDPGVLGVVIAAIAKGARL
jgi:hypothetical protein